MTRGGSNEAETLVVVEALVRESVKADIRTTAEDIPNFSRFHTTQTVSWKLLTLAVSN